ncbi:phage tail fiber assembly protein [Escherichia coli EC96038]|nr:phage tail fiber assembly protein [Escherichia coli EC96038]
MLPQHSDIEIAWYAAIQQEPNGWKTVTTQFEPPRVSWRVFYL